MPEWQGGPTEIDGSRTVETDGYRFVFYPDVLNSTRTSGCQASTFYWMLDRLYLARKEGTGARPYDFSFSRYTRLGGRAQEDVCGMVRFTLVADVPENVINNATHKLYMDSTISDPYWGTASWWSEAYIPLTFHYTHTTLSGTGVNSAHVVRRLTGADPWYCEKQGATTGPITVRDRRTYTTLMGKHYTELFHRAVVENAEPLTVNRTLGIEFVAPTSSFTLRGNWPAVRAELLKETRGTDRDITLDRIRSALDRARTAGDLAVDCVPDHTVPDDSRFVQNLLRHTGCTDGRFLELARAAVLEGAGHAPTALATDADGPPNPWGTSWRVAPVDPPDPELNGVTEGAFRYLRPISVPTRFSPEFEEIRADAATYFFTHYPDDTAHTLQRVFRPVIAHDNPAVASVSVCCGYPDTTGKILWEGRVFPRPSGADGEPGPGPWVYRTTQKSKDEIADPPPGWAPDRTFVKRRVQLRPGAEASGELCVVQNDAEEIDIDPGPHGALFNDVAIDVSVTMVRHLDVHPIRLHRKAGRNETVRVRLEALNPSGEPDGTHAAEFRWQGDEDHRARRWIVFPDTPDFPARFRYRVTVQNGEISRTGPWIASCGSGSLHIFAPPMAKSRRRRT
ncbi:hypothetical protein [Streptomyces sp. NPDC051173]|uniref:hypothetical protein n=1 Tax=Streptomyces sp. NPDC051173 TaxID=3155164 RepID=UPI00344B15EF